MRAYEYRHIVSFEETNLVGNVYYVNHLRWQGRCRELFLREYAPSVIDQLKEGLSLVTTHCSCDYLDELVVYDEVVIRMTLGAMGQSRLKLDFEYWTRDTLVARGSQQVACMHRENGTMAPAALPGELRDALKQFM